MVQTNDATQATTPAASTSDTSAPQGHDVGARLWHRTQAAARAHRTRRCRRWCAVCPMQGADTPVAEMALGPHRRQAWLSRTEPRILQRQCSSATSQRVADQQHGTTRTTVAGARVGLLRDQEARCRMMHWHNAFRSANAVAAQRVSVYSGKHGISPAPFLRQEKNGGDQARLCSIPGVFQIDLDVSKQIAGLGKVSWNGVESRWESTDSARSPNPLSVIGIDKCERVAGHGILTLVRPLPHDVGAVVPVCFIAEPGRCPTLYGPSPERAPAGRWAVSSFPIPRAAVAPSGVAPNFQNPPTDSKVDPS